MLLPPFLLLLLLAAESCASETRNRLSLVRPDLIVAPGHVDYGARRLQAGASVTVRLVNAATGGGVVANRPAGAGSTGSNLGNVVRVTVADAGSSLGAGNLSSVWVGLYTPADSDPMTTTPIRFQSLIWDPAWLTLRTAALNFTVSNLHTGGYAAFVFLGGTATNSSGPSGPNSAPVDLLNQAGVAAQQPGYNGLAGQLTSMSGGDKPFTSVTGALPPALAASPPANAASNNAIFGGVLLGSSTPVVFESPNEPTHVRATVGAGIGVYIFTWNQQANSTGGFIQLFNATTGAALTATLAATPAPITVNMTCANSAASTTGWRSMGMTWSATVNLALYAGQVVAYRVGDATAATDKPPLPTALLFSVPPPAIDAQSGANTAGISVMMFADMGFGVDNLTDQGYQGRNYNDGKAALAIARRAALHAQGAASPAVSAIIIAGDLTYGDGYLGQTEEWFEMMQPAISRASLLWNGGNHEFDFSANVPGFTSYTSPDSQTEPPAYLSTKPNGPVLGTTTQPYPGYSASFASFSIKEQTNSISSGGECGLIARFLPASYATPAAPWHTLSVGPLLIISISSEHNTSVGSPQYLWLVATLAGINRAETPWVLTHTHRNMYITMSPCTTTGVLNAGTVGAGLPGDPCSTLYNYLPSGNTNPNRWASESLNMLLLQQNLEPLFLAAGVNLHLAGHTHVTQRQCAAANNTCVRMSTAGAGSGAPAVYNFSSGVALTYKSPLSGSISELPYVPVYYTISNAGAESDAVGNTVEQGNQNSSGAIGFSGAIFSAPNWAYATLTVVSPTVLDVRIFDAFSGAVIDYSRIVQPARPAVAQPTTYFVISSALSLSSAVGDAAGTSTAALAAMLFGVRCDMAAASGLPLAAAQLVTVAPGGAASVAVASTMSAAMLTANALANCSRSPAGGALVVPVACTATGARRAQGADENQPFTVVGVNWLVASNNPAAAALAGSSAALAAYAAAAATRINAAVAINALPWTNGQLSVVAGVPNFWKDSPFKATSTAPATVSQTTPLAAAAAAPAGGLSNSQMLGLGLGIALPLAAAIAIVLACAAAMHAQGAAAADKLRADVAARARAPPAVITV